LQAAIGDRTQHHQLAVFAFDLPHYDGIDFRSVPLIERRLQLTELVARTKVHCLHLVQGFDNGTKLFQGGRATWVGGHCFEAAVPSLLLGSVPRLGQGQNGGVASCEPRAVAAV
jgi:hypothetical protein